MNDYISREAVLSKCQQIWSNADETTEIGVAIINIVDELADFVENISSTDVQPVKQDTELSFILQDYSIKDTDTLRYILDQYQKIIVDITGGQMSYLTYPAQAVIECTNDYYLSALADFKKNLVKHGQWIDHEELIGIFGTLCDYMVDNCKCDVFCPYADTKDKNDECEAWRTIQKIRQEG